MIQHTFALLNRTIRQLTLVLSGALLCFGLMQSAVQAAPTIALEQTQTTTPIQLDSAQLKQKRALRREAQSKASQAANTEEEANSLDEVLNEKLNLDEIREDNVFVESSDEAPVVAPSRKLAR